MSMGSFGVVVAALAVIGGSLVNGSQTARAPRGSGPAEPQAASVDTAPVVVSTSLSQTAVWVGDPIVWTVELTCQPSVDVIEDDLAGDKLDLVGLELENSELEHITGEDGTIVHRVRYHFRPFDVETQQLQTGALKVRYFTRGPGQRVEDLTPDGEVQVPGAVLAWRSTIPDKLKVVDLRYARAAETEPSWLRLSRPVGLGLVLISVVPVVVWGASRIEALRRPRQRRPSLRASRSAVLSALESLRGAGTATEEERREAYGRLSDTLRQHVANTTGLPATALTTDEVISRLRERGFSVPPEAVSDVLTECDRARYGPPATLPTSDEFRDRLTATERLL